MFDQLVLATQLALENVNSNEMRSVMDTDSYIFGVTPAVPALAIVLFICAFYFTWEPKLIRFLRGYLRAREYRDRAD